MPVYMHLHLPRDKPAVQRNLFLVSSNMWNKLQIGCLTELLTPKHIFKALVCSIVHYNVMQHVFYSFNVIKCIHINKLSVIAVVPF